MSAPPGHRDSPLALSSWCRVLCGALIAATLQTTTIPGAFAQEPAVADSAASNENYAWVGGGLGV